MNADRYASFHIDYLAAFKEWQLESFADRVDAMLHDIRPLWVDSYRDATQNPTSVCRFEYGDFTFIYDDTDELIHAGQVRSSDIHESRVVAAYGISKGNYQKRDKYRISSYLGRTGEVYSHFGTGYDKGHFIANAAGGPLEINLFPQKRVVNRGWSAEGKQYREMERYIADHPGTFVFSRPFYDDHSLRPVWIEFGYLTADGSFSSAIFDNL